MAEETTVERYRAVLNRPASQMWVREPAYRDLFEQTIRLAGFPEAAVTDANVTKLANGLLVFLRLRIDEAMDSLPGHVQEQYRALMTRDPAPSDQDLVAYWRNTIPNFDALYDSTSRNWRASVIASNKQQ